MSFHLFILKCAVSSRACLWVCVIIWEGRREHVYLQKHAQKRNLLLLFYITWILKIIKIKTVNVNNVKMELRHDSVVRETSKAKPPLIPVLLPPVEQGTEILQLSWWVGIFYLKEWLNPFREVFVLIYKQLKFAHKSLSESTVYVRKYFQWHVASISLFISKENIFISLYKNIHEWVPWRSSVQASTLLLPRVQVQSLIRVLRSSKLRGATKKEKENPWIFKLTNIY